MKKEEALNIIETFLTDEQLSRLKGVSDMTGAPISTIIQIAVEDYLKNLPKSLTHSLNRPEQTP
jgi:predicted DNA-binding protein